MEEPVQIKQKTTQLVRAKSPQCLGGQADTGSFCRKVMLYTNLDFLYIFSDGEIDGGKLLESFRLVLDHYPTMTGRAAPCGRKIDLNNSGAAFTVAAAPGASVADLPLETPIGAPYCHIPSPKGQAEGKEPLLTVTLTKFDEGCTLGVVMSHLISDGWTFAMFMKDWSDLHNGLAIEPVVFQLPESATMMCAGRDEADEMARAVGQKRSSVIKQRVFRFVMNVVLPRLMASDDRGANQVKRLVLHFTDDEVSRIKSEAEARAKTWVSTNEALLAYLWPIFLNAADVNKTARQLLGAGVPVNLRGKIDGVSHRVAGNAIVVMGLRCDLSNDIGLEKQLHDNMRSSLTEEKLSNLIRLQNYVWNNVEFDWHEDAEVGDILLGGLRGNIGWNNQMSSPFYDLNFGTGRPARGVLWNWDQPLTIMRGSQGGIDIYIDKGLRGHATWKRPPRLWNNAKIFFSLGAAGSAAALLKLGFSRDSIPVALFGGFMCGMSTLASKRARLQADQCTEDFFKDIERNAHRINLKL